MVSFFDLPGKSDAYRAVTSKTAQRTYLYAVLLTITSSILYGIAILGYLGFYREYVPHQVRTAPVHLQYASAHSLPSAASTKAGSRLFAAESALQQHPQGAHPHHPFALADLRGLGLKTDQEYDLSVVLSVPRSPNNLQVGNFMVELALAASSVSSASSAITTATRLPPANPRDFLESGGKRLLFAASRPGLMAYTDPVVAQATRLTLLPVHFFSPEAASRTRLIVPMAESLAFSGSGGPSAVLPAVLYLELRTGGEHELQTYGAEVVFSAKLRGLRWLMYHHRVFSFLLLTTTWWLIEVVFMLAVFVAFGIFFGANRGDNGFDIGHSNASSITGTPGHKLSKQLEPKKEEGRGTEAKQLPEKKTGDSGVKSEPPSIKKEPEDVSFGKETSKLAAIPPEAVTTTKPAEKDSNVAKDTKHADDSTGTKDDSKGKSRDNKAPSPTAPSHKTPPSGKTANNRKSIINEPDEDGDDHFNDDDDDDDYDDDEGDAEPIIPPSPSRKQKKPQPQSQTQSRTSSPASPKKTNKNKDSAGATGRPSTPPADSTPVRQKPPKKEASNLSTTSTASGDHGSPARKRMSQSVNDIQQKAT
ncbi:hypothetical protein HMPREF1624_04502 [Sporothrix schenckii ATCC 58251]|uniref:Seipin n=1 Tax=Sporothrix schenckii (strain ATCC 58251 / de Perez 2211183) TaxID=1391915 RepID=U7PUJ5_SPOS1|nr:hypothetical protein HMPREF1624_04502 [Sporothrix schenckii ATCC 58251]